MAFSSTGCLELTQRGQNPNGARFAPWAVGLVAVASGYATGRGVSDWNLTHWLFNYDLEFTRRGLVGAVIWRLLEPDPDLVRQLGIGLLIVCSAALILFTTRSLRRRSAAFRVGFAVLTVACPATLTQFGYDCGRFDQFNVILFLAALVLIERGKVAAPYGVAVLTMIALLVHEAFLVIHVPVLVGTMIHRSGGRVSRGLVFVGASALIVGTLVLRFGALETVDHETYRSQLVESYDLNERSVYYSSRVLYQDLPDNFAYATRILPKRFLSWRSVAILLVLAPWLWAALVTLRTLNRGIDPARRRGFWLPVIAAASPLLLAVVGSDLFRWWTLSVLNLFVVTLVLVRMHSEAVIRFSPNRKRITILVGLSLLVGPVGVDSPFPRSRNIRVLVEEGVLPVLRETSHRLDDRQNQAGAGMGVEAIVMGAAPNPSMQNQIE